MLLLAAGDVADEGNAASHIKDGTSNVQVWQVTGSGHTKALYTYPREWEHRVTAFLAAALREPTP